MSRIRLGDMLVQAQMVSPAQIDEALAHQRERGGRLGELLVELGHVTEVQLAQVLSNQLSVPWVNLYHVDFSRELLNLLPAEMAEKYGAIPVYVRKVRKQGDTLFVATDDPTNDLSLAEIAVQVDMPVKPMVASSSDVRNAIRVYYFGGRETAATAPIVKRRPPSIAAPPPSAVPSIAPIELDPAELDEEASEPSIAAATAPAPAAAAAAPAPSPAAAPTPTPAAAPAAPAPKKKKRGKMITLTLLDGTTVTLPASGDKKGAEDVPDEALTTRDLIQALQARAEGKDVSSVLPDARWEPLFAALLSLLLRKGLIADWEFVEEWSKHRR
jgi:type IV pilus assembly protein PilB